MPGLWPGSTTWRTSRTEYIDEANAPVHDDAMMRGEPFLGGSLEQRLAQIAAVGQDRGETGEGPGKVASKEPEEQKGDSVDGGKDDADDEDEDENEDEDEDDDEEMCHICMDADEDDLVRLLPCAHRCICHKCYKEQLRDVGGHKVHCPICMQEAADYRTIQEEEEDEELAREQRGSAVDVKLARARADEQLAGTHIEKVLGFERDATTPLDLGFFEVSESDLRECFGIGLMGFFRQTRILWLASLALALFSTPLVLTYLTSIREAAHRPDGILGLYENEVRKWSLPTCTRDDCRLLFEQFLAVDAAGALVAGLLTFWMGRVTLSRRRKDTKVFDSPELNVAARTLLVIPAPHRTDAVDRRTLETFFEDLQLARIRAKQRAKASSDPRTLFLRETMPPVRKVRITGLLNCSSENLRFARAAEHRLELLADIESLKKRLARTSSITKEFRRIEDALTAATAKLRQLERAYFEDLFLQEELGAVTRTARHKVDYLFITFEDAAHASFARELMHHDKRHWLTHHLCLMLGAPLTQLRALGSAEEVYPSNIDWFRLEHPHWYAQTGWPARCAIALFVAVAANAVVGYFVWDWANDVGGNFAGAAFLVVWHKASRAALCRAFDWYGHPLRSFSVYYAVLVSVVGIDVVSYLGWPLLWSLFSAYRRDPLSYSWWADRILTNLTVAQGGHCALSLAWFFGLRRLSRWVARVAKGHAWTQYELDKDYCPHTWSLARAYMASLRTAVLCIPYSGICSWLAPLAAAHLAVLYASEKLDLLNATRFPYRAETSATGVLCARVVEFCVAGRLLISGLALRELFGPMSSSATSSAASASSGRFSALPGLALDLPRAGLVAAGGVLLVGGLLRASTVRRAAWSALTLRGALLAPWKSYQAARRPLAGAPDNFGAKPRARGSAAHGGGGGGGGGGAVGPYGGGYPGMPRRRRASAGAEALFDVRSGPRLRGLFPPASRAASAASASSALAALRGWAPEPAAPLHRAADARDPAQTPLLRRLRALRAAGPSSSSSSSAGAASSSMASSAS